MTSSSGESLPPGGHVSMTSNAPTTYNFRCAKCGELCGEALMAFDLHQCSAGDSGSSES